MGNTDNGAIVNELEDILGLREDDDATDDVVEDSDDNADDEESVVVAPVNTAALNDEQIAIHKEIGKIDAQIETLKSQSVDVGAFYDNLDQHLSEAEQALEFENKSAYMKLVSEKAKAYEDEKSSASAIAELESKKTQMEAVYARNVAIASVSVKYPAYDHEKMIDFFENKISKEQQSSIFDASESYADVYENTYKLFAQSNKTGIKSESVPPLPNVNNSRRQTVNNQSIDDGLSSEDDKLKLALGL